MQTNETIRNILVAVDVQNDFINGSLAVGEAQDVVQPINSLANAVRSVGGHVAFTRDWHPETTPHFETWSIHCVAGTDGAAFSPQLTVEPNDIVLSKGMGQTDGYSGWEGVTDTGTTLETLIDPRSPHEKVRVFIGGLATDYCVKATALDIAHTYNGDERIRLYLVRDAVRAVNLQPSDEQTALDTMAAAKLQAISSHEAIAMIERI